MGVRLLVLLGSAPRLAGVGFFAGLVGVAESIGWAVLDVVLVAFVMPMLGGCFHCGRSWRARQGLATASE